jgi:hypothetical protein
MRDFKLEKAREFDKSFIKIETETTSVDLKDIAVAFHANMFKVLGLAELMPISLALATRTQHMRDKACLHVNKTSIEFPSDHNSETATKIVEEYQKLLPMTDDDWPHFVQVGDIQTNMWASAMPQLSPAIEALLSAILMGAWTAFESSASDLWRRAVNLRPFSLGEYCWQSRKSKAKDIEDTSAEREQRKSVPFALLKEHRYDISKVIGSILEERRVVNFDSLGGIRAAFEATFMLDETHPSTKLKDIFDHHNADMISLQAMRNLLAHRGGVVDQSFLDEVSKSSKYLSELSLGSNLPLDGEFIAKYVDVSSKMSVELIRYVDKWLQDKPN